VRLGTLLFSMANCRLGFKGAGPTAVQDPILRKLFWTSMSQIKGSDPFVLLGIVGTGISETERL